MLKEKVYAGGRGGQAVLSSGCREDNTRLIALTALWALVGLLVPRAGVYGGMAPFGVGVAAAVSGPGAIVVYLTTIVGYLLPDGTAFPLRYIAAIAAVGGIRWALSSLPALSRRALFSPALAFSATAATGIAMTAAGGMDIYKGLVIAAESLITAGFAYFFSATVHLSREWNLRTVLTAGQQSAMIVTGAVVLMALASVTVSGISPGRIVAVIGILLFARCGKEQGGCIAGVILGVAMALAGPAHMYLAAAYAFGGLMAGVFARFGRFAAAGAFMVSNIIVYMGAVEDITIVAGIYEIVAAAVLFVVLPQSLDRKINALFVHGRDIPAVEGLRRSMLMRLDCAAKAMNEVADTVDVVSQKLAGLSAPDLGGIYRGISDNVCRVCGLQMYCWETCFSDTMTSFNDLTPLLREKGYVEKGQVAGHLARHCGRLDELVRRVNSGYSEHLVREGAWRRLSEIRSVVTDQFAGLSDLLGELSDEFATAEQVDTEAAARVIAVCEDHGLLVRDALCCLGRNNRMTVEILASDVGVKLKNSRWFRDICDACGRAFDHPVTARLEECVKISLSEKPLFTLSVGTSQLPCTCEKLCGDAFDCFSDGTGCTLVVLSDGMGSGGRAAVDGAMAVELTSRLLKAGFGADSVLRLVNSALMVKSGDESLATLDVTSVDLFSGRLENLKAGAAASLLRSMGRVSRIEKSSLPVGILRDVSFERSTDTLVDGDILLLMSDGAIAHGIAWVEETLRDFDAKTGSMNRLAEDIARQARQKQSAGHEDDITIVAMQMTKRV